MQPVLRLLAKLNKVRRGCQVALPLIAMATVLLVASLPQTVVAQRKQCVDCHKDFKKSISKRHVHSPVDDGCETCHKRHGFSQKLVLTKPMPALCVECHENVNEELASPNIHGALSKGGCTICHDPHASDEKALLRELEEGSVCMLCHTELSSVFADENSHKPFRKGECEVCHAPHASDNPDLLVDSESAVCESCHKNAVGKHDFAGVTDVSCSDCHDPHAVSKKTQFAGYAHEPFSAGECDACHDIENNEVVIGDAFPPADLCGDCHDDMSALLEGGESHFGEDTRKMGGASTCLGCHDPHSTRHGSLFAEPQKDVCGKCHENLPTEKNYRGMLHEPYESGDCSTCHESHGGGGDHHLTQELSPLCESCHADILAAPAEGQTRHEALELMECTDCHEAHAAPYPSMLSELPEDRCAECHDKQSFSGVTHAPYASMQCGACHSNHSMTAGLLLAPEKSLCTKCHENITKDAVATFAHAPVQEESCSLCHESHGGEHLGLLNESQDDLCLGCHGLEDLVLGDAVFESETAAANASTTNLHAPVANANCSGCHSPHGSEIEGMLARENDDLCYGCHNQEKISFQEGKVHAPVAGGDCNSCHTPHGTTEAGLRKVSEPDLCTQCHDFGQPPLAGSHQGFNVTQTTCTGCHDPHNSNEDHLLNHVVHEPFADDDCESCHANPQDLTAVAAIEANVCLDCHDEKSEGVGHQLTGDLECTVCHTPHASKFPNLLHNPMSLCTDCHSDLLHPKLEPGQTVTLHKPLDNGTCLDCHKLHDPSGDHFLVTNQQTLCSSCHESVRERTDHATKHDPFAKDKCESCHTTHASTDRHMLKKDEERLCKSCHKLGTEAMDAKHGNIPLSGEGCSSCHDPHSTDRPGTALLLPVLHSPYEDGDCSSCHSDGAAAAQNIAMCLDCHEGDHDYSLVHNAGRPGSELNSVGVCLDCHSPHAGHEGMIKRSNQAETCYQCHDRQEFSREVVHGALDEGCTACHNLHENNYNSVLKSAPLNDLCISCHEDEKMHAHPIGAKHKDPRTGGPLICTSCHEPHASNHDLLMTFDYERDLCVQCHAAGTMKIH